MPGQENNFSVASSAAVLNRLDRLYSSPALILAAVAVSVFFSEAAVMVALSFFTHLSNPVLYFIDSLLLTSLLIPVLVILVFRPIDLHLAKRRHAEKELAADRNKLRGILDAMPAGVFIVNRHYEFEYTNSSLLKEFGPVDGLTCHDYFPDWSEACEECRVEDFQGKGVTKEYHSEKTGKIYEIFETPLRDADGTVSKLEMVRDITAVRTADDELRASREKLRSLSVHLQKAREEERTAVSREIHDELGQVLATVQLGVSSLGAEYRDHRHLIGKISEMEDLLAGAIRTVQRISTQLRPAILDELGLAEAIEWQAAEFCKRTGIDCTPDIFLQGTNFSTEVATAVFRIFQESLTNVMRHSEATAVVVTLAERNNRLVLIVTDNGCGITPQQIRDCRSLGITGMRERAYALGGRVRICLSPQRGTVVIARIPIHL